MYLPRCKISIKSITSGCLLLLGSWLYAAATPPLTVSQLISAREKIARMAQQLTQTQMRWATGESHIGPQVSVVLEIDEPRLEQDYQKFINEQTLLLEKNKAEQLQKQKQYIEDLVAAAKIRDDLAIKEAEETWLAKEAKLAQEAKLATALKEAEDAKQTKPGLAKSEPRLGMLNIDMSSLNQASEANDKTETRLAASATGTSSSFTVPMPPPPARSSQTIALSIAMPSADISDASKFDYDIMDYVKSLSIMIVLPEKLPSQLEESIRQAIVTALELKIFQGADTSKIVEFSVLAIDKNQPTWRDQFINPEKGRVWDLSSALILGLLLLVGTLIVAKGFTKIAAGIRELKADKAETADQDIVDVTGTDARSPTPGEQEAEGERPQKSYDPASVQALTSEMKNIRDQLSELIQSNSSISAELIRDMLYETHGFHDFRDILSFAGYNALKPAMDLLPRSSLDELTAFIEDHHQDSSSLLNGVEVAQRLYRGIISRFTEAEASDQGSDFGKLRMLVIKIEDGPLSQMMGQLEPPEIALLINILSSERGSIMMKQLSQTQIKEACQFLDASPKELSVSIRSLVKKLELASEKSDSKISQKQRRFIFRMARKASLAEEEFVKMLIPAEDWQLKKSIMEIRFFFCDLIYVSPIFLRETIDSFKMSFRAEFLFILPDELQKNIIETYTKGSKLRDLLTSELEDVKQNPQRSESVQQAREGIIDKFMEKFRTRFVADPRQMHDVILKQCELNNWQPPAELLKPKTHPQGDKSSNSAA